jgi:hypothetical protein
VAAAHRVGPVALGESSVIVAVSAAHRRGLRGREATDRTGRGRSGSARAWPPRTRARAMVEGTPPPSPTPESHDERATHLDDSGSARMVDVGGETTERRAIAGAGADVARDRGCGRAGNGPKGDVIGAARLAASRRQAHRS